MKKFFLVMAVIASLTTIGCKKSSGDDGGDVIPNTPRTEVPAEMLTPEGKYWSIGTISSVYFHNTTSGAYYDYIRNGGGVVVFFKFKPGGYFENLVYVVVNSYGTETETWTSIEGTVEFTTEQGVPVFKTHATKGTYRIRQNGKESKRGIPAGDLTNQHSNTFLWQLWDNPDDQLRRYFLLVNLDHYPEVDLNDIQGTVRPEMVNKFHVEE
jgi:hypothetical protein